MSACLRLVHSSYVKRGTGLVKNELYIGRLIWNCLRYIKDPSTGKRVSRLNPESEWIIKDVPELRIVDDELWQSVRALQGEIAEKYANVTEVVRKHHKKNRLNGTRRPKSLLSGLVFCGCCGAPTRFAALIGSLARTTSARAPVQTAARSRVRNWKPAYSPA